MNRHYIGFSLCFMIFVLAVVSRAPFAVRAESVRFNVEQVAWGTSTDAPVEVEPGDTNAPLTVDIGNLSNKTLKRVYGTLQLNSSGPFTDYFSGTHSANATGVPLQAGDIFNQTGEIAPAGSFAFTFRLDIARNAAPGYYPHQIAVEYLFKWENNTWVVGEPQTLQVMIILPNRSPTIDAFTPSATAVGLNAGDSLNFTATCSDPDNDTITYEWRLDSIMVSNKTQYTYLPASDDVGVHTLELTVSDGHLSVTQSWTVTVTPVSVSHFVVSSNYITGGFDNQLNITIQNNLWKDTVQLGLAVPQPLIVRGNESWVFRSLQPSRNLSIAPLIYAPETAIGSTFTAALTVNYDDEHGLSYTDTYNVGLIVQGYLKLIVYDVVVDPQPVDHGREITITATALNTGNVVASYANVSLQPNSVLELLRESSSYMGEIETNSPVPFTIIAKVKSEIQNGTYPLTINLTYQDDQYRQHALTVAANLVVATGAASSQASDGTSNILSFISNGGWTIVVVIGVGIVLAILYVRRLSKAKQKPKQT